MVVWWTRGPKRRGMVLLVVLSVLAVLSVLGVTFTLLNGVERRTASNHLRTIEARLLARAGLEDAVSRLSGGQVLRDSFDPEARWRYFGDDVDGTRPELRLSPLETAKRPSFALGAVGRPVEQIRIRTRDGGTQVVGVSGRMRQGGHLADGSVYSLEVRDLSACLHVNDGVRQAGGNRSSVSQNLRRILNALGRHSAVQVGRLGDLVIDNRPARGYASWEDLRSILVRTGRVRGEHVDRLEPFLTVQAWVDKNVVNPVPFSAKSVHSYPVDYGRGSQESGGYRRGPGRDHRSADRSQGLQLLWMPDAATQKDPGATAMVYGQDELVPTYVEVVHRAPVNVNTAPEPVLMALLEGLRGVFLMESRTGAPLHPGGPDIEYVGRRWVVPNTTLSIKSGHSWEYRGHTYADSPWLQPTRIEEHKSWEDTAGATTESTEVRTLPVGDDDALGQLWITPALEGGEGTVSGPSARYIAGELIRCRERRGAYADLAFGGPFRNWTQFHAFCDHLAAQGQLDDPRFPEGPSRRQAAQAMADVLKANFNPNFHANELNPDHNLHLKVDKTDLVVNSTEFCFLPTGLFRVRSIGRVLAPGDASGLRVVVEGALSATVKVHDLYRETSQRHFYGGLSARARVPQSTNNGRLVEPGPEPDNGPLVYGEHFGGFRQVLDASIDGYAGYESPNATRTSGWGYEASGYLALPTAGGTGELHVPNTLAQTLAADGPLDTADGRAGLVAPSMVAHFRYDDRLSWNESSRYQDAKLDIFRDNAGGLRITGDSTKTIRRVVYDPATCANRVIDVPIPNPYVEKASNFPDPGEERTGPKGSMLLSPYDPTDGTRFRLLRSYRQPASGSPTEEAQPELKPTPPSDLRVDGFYSERHSGLAYWIDEDASFSTTKGAVSFWFKPNFDPAVSGKIRTIATAAKYHRANFYHRNPLPFTLTFLPAHLASGEIRTLEYRGAWGPGFAHLPVSGGGLNTEGLTSVSPASLLFNVAWSTFDGTGWDAEWSPLPPGVVPGVAPQVAEMERYCGTPVLNSAVQGDRPMDRDGLRANRWSHVTMAWSLLESGQPSMKILVNGRVVNGTREVTPAGYAPVSGATYEKTRRPSFAVQSFIDHDHPDDGRWSFGEPEEATDRIIENTLRLGEVSTHGFESFPRNFSSDGTYDELYVWTRIGAREIDSLTQKGPREKYRQGRYYVPASGEEATWTSPVLRLFGHAGRHLAPPAAARLGSRASEPDEDLAIPAVAAPAAEPVRMLGVSWTWYPESWRPAEGPSGSSIETCFVDYADADAPRLLPQPAPACRLQLETGGLQYPLNDVDGFADDAFSTIETSEGQPVDLAADGSFRYRVRFHVAGARPGTVLLSTPVFDDVTFYYSGGTEYLDYQPGVAAR